MAAFLRGRIALLAVLVAAFFAATGAAAQSDKDVARSLRARIEAADERLIDELYEKLDAGRPASRDEVQTLFVRGFEYYRARDYYTAGQLFAFGLASWGKMGWPRNDTSARADYYRSLASKRFCIDDEAPKCEANLRHYGRRYVDEVGAIQRDLSREEAFPAELRAEAKRECRGALEKLRALCRADRGGSDSCRNIPPC